MKKAKLIKIRIAAAACPPVYDQSGEGKTKPVNHYRNLKKLYKTRSKELLEKVIKDYKGKFVKNKKVKELKSKSNVSDNAGSSSE